MDTVSVVSVVLAAPGAERTFQTPCEADPELFFPIGTSGPSLLQTAEAKARCHTCPKLESCREHALQTDEEGVWGGLSQDERRAIRRRTVRRGGRR